MVMFTLNGEAAGKPFSFLGLSLYPTVGVNSPHVVRWNFGQEPFRFGRKDEFEASDIEAISWNDLQVENERES
ncbi:hypothetical protein AC1031_012644 [Aphanomyces cochlioides]|nr:hypothetical protein AC1031_012644 [Aphanomyces cochlioides]